MNSIFVERIRDLKQDLRDGLKFVDWERIVKPGSTVFLKPNLTWPQHEKGVTTSPVFIENLVDILRERAGRIIIGESDGGNHAFTADESFRGHDLERISREKGVELVNLSRIPAVEVEEEILGKKVKVILPKLLLEEIDCFVSVPVLKVHAMTGVSISIKNLWGCYSDPMRCLHHKHLDHKLALITKLLKPALVVVDGTYALNGHGPMFGEAVEMNILICSDNPVVADRVGAMILGMKPDEGFRFSIAGLNSTKLTHITIASRAGLGPFGFRDVRKNQDWEQFAKHFDVNKTLMDRFCILPFNSEVVSRIVFDSALTKVIFWISDQLIRNEKELDMAVSCRTYPKEDRRRYSF